MGKINKDDLDPQVVALIDSLEEDNAEMETALTAVTEAATTLKAENDALKARVAKYDVAEADDDEKFEAVLKSASPEVAEVLKQQRAQNAQMQAQLIATRDADVQRTMLTKAAALPHLQGTKEELAAVLKECFDVPSEFTKADGTTETKTLGDKVEAVLKAANAQLESASIFGEIGKSGGGVTVASSVEAAAEELRKSDPTLTQEQAIAKAYENNPELYVQSITQEA